MRVFRSFTHKVAVSVESLLDQLENQEAVVAAMIRQVEAGATRVRVHRKACERRVQNLETRIAELEHEARIWKERAQRLAADREKGLECVRRKVRAERERQSLQQELELQRGLLRRILEDERTIETKLADLRRRSVALSAREVCATIPVETASGVDVDSVFDRWEARIEEREAVREVSVSADAFSETLTREEERAALEQELSRILEEERAQ